MVCMQISFSLAVREERKVLISSQKKPYLDNQIICHEVQMKPHSSLPCNEKKTYQIRLHVAQQRRQVTRLSKTINEYYHI